MVANLLANPIVPVSNPRDAADTYEQLRPYLLETEFVPILVHVIEKAGGAPDKAGVEQRREHAERTFEAFRGRARTDGVESRTELRYGTDIAATIHDAATDLDASCIVFSSRGESGWLDHLTGNVRARLIVDHELPVIVLPSEARE